MKVSLGIGAMLVTAVLAGAAGGAVALSAAQGDPAPAPAAPVTLHQVAEEATSSPTPTASVAAEADDSEPASAPVVHNAPVSDPAPILGSVPKPETASEAADRAKAEADRAKQEADRAAEVATAPKPVATPVPAKTVEPAPQPFCAAKGYNPRGNIGETRIERVEPTAGRPDQLPKDGYEVTWKCLATDNADGGAWASVKVKTLPAPVPVQTGGQDPD